LRVANALSPSDGYKPNLLVTGPSKGTIRIKYGPDLTAVANSRKQFAMTIETGKVTQLATLRSPIHRIAASFSEKRGSPGSVGGAAAFSQLST
jgi:hypothetical protein